MLRSDREGGMMSLLGHRVKKMF